MSGPGPERDAELERRWLANESTQAIADAMHLTKNQVIGRAKRINLPGRPSPIRPKQDGEPRTPQPPRARPARRHGASELQVAQQRAKSAQSQTRPTISRHLESALAVSVSHVSQCRWPMWADGERPGPSPRFCCEPTRPGQSWCEVHCAIVFVPRNYRPLIAPVRIGLEVDPEWDKASEPRDVLVHAVNDTVTP